MLLSQIVDTKLFGSRYPGYWFKTERGEGQTLQSLKGSFELLNPNQGEFLEFEIGWGGADMATDISLI